MDDSPPSVDMARTHAGMPPYSPAWALLRSLPCAVPGAPASPRHACGGSSASCSASAAQAPIPRIRERRRNARNGGIGPSVHHLEPLPNPGPWSASRVRVRVRVRGRVPAPSARPLSYTHTHTTTTNTTRLPNVRAAARRAGPLPSFRVLRVYDARRSAGSSTSPNRVRPVSVPESSASVPAQSVLPFPDSLLFPLASSLEPARVPRVPLCVSRGGRVGSHWRRTGVGRTRPGRGPEKGPAARARR